MKLTIVVLLVCVSLSQAFDLLSSFKKWTGEVEETLDINKNNEHAERFLDEVNDKGLELMKKHEELGKDMWGKHRNRVEKIWNNMEHKIPEEPEVPPTEPSEPEIKPTELSTEVPFEEIEKPNESHGDAEYSGTEEPIPEVEPEMEITTAAPIEEVPEEPTEVPEEPTEAYKEPTEDYKEPTEDYEEPTEDYKEPTEEPAIEPTEVPEVKTQAPEEIISVIEEPIEEAVDNDSDDDYDSDDGYDSDDDNDSDEDSYEVEEVYPVKVSPEKQDEVISVDQIDVAPRQSYDNEPVEIQWLKKRQHKLSKLWRKYTAKQSEKVLSKIMKLNEKIAMKRENDM